MPTDRVLRLRLQLRAAALCTYVQIGIASCWQEIEVLKQSCQCVRAFNIKPRMLYLNNSPAYAHSGSKNYSLETTYLRPKRHHYLSKKARSLETERCQSVTTSNVEL